MNQNLIFSVQTIHTGRDATRAVLPNKEGIYKGIPVSVIGKASRNNIYYEPDSFKNAITNTDTPFYKSLIEGSLEGEWQHPDVAGMPDKLAISRILRIDRNEVSHYFSRIFTKTVDGYVVVYADIKPFGPKGQFLDESFKDANRDTGFSLRSITSEPVPRKDGSYSKSIVALTTFDAVGIQGYKEASKKYSISSEGWTFYSDDADAHLKISLNDAMHNEQLIKAAGFENVHSQQLLDMFQTDKIVIKKETSQRGILDKDNKLIITPNGNKSVFHSLF